MSWFENIFGQQMCKEILYYLFNYSQVKDEKPIDVVKPEPKPRAIKGYVPSKRWSL